MRFSSTTATTIFFPSSDLFWNFTLTTTSLACQCEIGPGFNPKTSHFPLLFCELIVHHASVIRGEPGIQGSHFICHSDTLNSSLLSKQGISHRNEKLTFYLSDNISYHPNGSTLLLGIFLTYTERWFLYVINSNLDTSFLNHGSQLQTGCEDQKIIDTNKRFLNRQQPKITQNIPWNEPKKFLTVLTCVAFLGHKGAGGKSDPSKVYSRTMRRKILKRTKKWMTYTRSQSLPVPPPSPRGISAASVSHHNSHSTLQQSFIYITATMMLSKNKPPPNLMAFF